MVRGYSKISEARSRLIFFRSERRLIFSRICIPGRFLLPNKYLGCRSLECLETSNAAAWDICIAQIDLKRKNQAWLSSNGGFERDIDL